MSSKILWIDDEKDMLKPYALFLEKKGYQVTFFNNATDGLEHLEKNAYDAILIDENMPGMTGLEALPEIQKIRPNTPVVMVTKSEEENIMEEAIGGYIADYLIKPINPNQVLLSLKKLLEKNKIVNDFSVSNYQKEFRQLSMKIMDARSHEDWTAVFKELTSWELKLQNIEDAGMLEILENQKQEANHSFCNFIEDNYLDWIEDKEGDAPVLSNKAFYTYVKPHLKEGKKVMLLMIDNLRYDQWKVIAPLFKDYYSIEKENLYYSFLPSATQYARNAFFAGLTPLEILKRFPDKWSYDHEPGGKNLHEKEFIRDLMKRLGHGDLSTSFHKVLNNDFEQKLSENFHTYKDSNLTTIVYNFIDILSHAKTDNQIVDEILRDDKTFRELAYTWFKNSSLLEIIKKAAKEKMKLIVTTDHGTIYVKRSTTVVGDKETSTNIRYKTGKNLTYEAKDVFEIKNPEKYGLPKANVSSKFIFAKEDFFLTYPKNQNDFINYYKGTYQHGGVSMEEMIIPIITLDSKL